MTAARMRSSSPDAAAAKVKRHPDDWYPTPEPVTRALLHHWTFWAGPDVLSPVWEPACGDCRMANVIADKGYAVIGTDLVFRGGIAQGGIDFLLEQRPLAPTIITNPPFKLASAFARHALTLRPQHVAMLLPIGFLGGQTRMRELWTGFPEFGAPQLLISGRRFSMWPGDAEIPADAGTTNMDFAWFIWSRMAMAGPPRWFDWKDFQ